jgi:2-keto-4-pentenoate hydratase/2-oxohepta-3-ene-1,7-dioic acid hydratase in catechol pathway
MRLRRGSDGVLIEDGGRWVSLAAALGASGGADPRLEAATEHVVAFLRADEDVRQELAELARDFPESADPAGAGLPFVPRSMRAFMLWESHVIQSSRMLVKHFFPAPVWRIVSTFERTGRTFPRLKPNKRFWEAPTFYVANHTMVLADGQEMWWPSHTRALDFELELACVLRAPLVDATPDEARAAVGGWFVLNDWSARDVQADDARRNVFGPVIKSKTFANSIGPDVVTPDELGDWTRVTGRVRVDGEVWCEGSTRDPAHDIGTMLAYASAGERLDAGDVISTGTMPGCCGLELERWIQPGQTVELEIDGIGSVSNRISRDATPATAVPADTATPERVRD